MKRALRTLAAAAAFALPLAFAPGASAADVVVEPPTGGSVEVDLPRGEEDVVNQEYTIRSASGERTETVTGFSLEWVIRQTGFGGNYQRVEVVRPDGSRVVLDIHQVEDGYGGRVPVVWKEADQTRFLRPVANGSDRNAGDSFAASPLRVLLRYGAVIEVEAAASPDRVRPGEKVTFSATATGPAGEELVYVWQFDDGSGATGRVVTHRYRKPGSYHVALTVYKGSAVGGSGGGSTVVEVRVGPPPKKGKKDPNREGGGRNRHKRAPDSGPYDNGQGAGPASVGDDRGAPEAPNKRPEPEPAPGTEPVEGELLDAPENAKRAVAESPSISARTGQLNEEENGFSVPGAVWGALVTGALLGVGTLRELGKLPQPKGRINPWS
ncbi:MAG TPA: PKD domain-containing protein [Solirubrobacterales bacterium]